MSNEKLTLSDTHIMRLKNKLKLFYRFYLKRLFAYLIDHIAIYFLSEILSILIISSLYRLRLLGLQLSYSHWENTQHIHFLMSYLSYFFFCFYLYQGRTIGLSLVKLQVKGIGFNQPSLTLKAAMIRSISNYVSYRIYCIPFWLMVINRNNQNLSDLASDSIISYDNRSTEAPVQKDKIKKQAA